MTNPAKTQPKCEVHVTRGVSGHPPDIWLTVEADITRPTIVHLTIAEAFELAHRLLAEAAEAAVDSSR